MTDLSVSIPPAMLSWLERRVAKGDYTDVGDLLRDLVRREQEEVREAQWLREQLEEGLASGIVDKEPEDVIEEIIAAYPADHA